MQLFAPAKINLFFHVLGRRDDGFHEIETLMAPISLCDELSIERDERRAGISFHCDDVELAGEENLVLKAARRFFAETREEARVRIDLRKNIPHGAGLGGGSSDAASTLLGLNRLYGEPVEHSRLTSTAAELGSDVPFFLAQSAARCSGRGERVEAVPGIPSLPLLLLKPRFGVPTPWAYSRWAEARKLPGVSYEPQQFAGIDFQNDLERPVFEKFIFLGALKEWLRAQPAVAVSLLSGSGSTVFAVLKDRAAADELAEKARKDLDRQLWTFGCETAGSR